MVRVWLWWCSEVFFVQRLLLPRGLWKVPLPGVLPQRVGVRLGVPELLWLLVSPPLSLWVVILRVAGIMAAVVTILIAGKVTFLSVSVNVLWRWLRRCTVDVCECELSNKELYHGNEFSNSPPTDEAASLELE